MSHLPANTSAAYRNLQRRAGKIAGQVLPLTKAEMWSVPYDRVATLKAAAARRGVIASIPIGDRYTPLDLSPQRRKDRTLAAVIDRIAKLANQQPVLAVFEDAHWIDPTSLELLSLTIERVARLPVLLIITARPDFSPPWPTHRHVSVMALGRLGPA